MFIVLTSFAATPLKKNNENPNGGVKKLVWRFNDINIPNQSGSAPLAINPGPTKGIMTKIISI